MTYPANISSWFTSSLWTLVVVAFAMQFLFYVFKFIRKVDTLKTMVERVSREEELEEEHHH